MRLPCGPGRPRPTLPRHPRPARGPYRRAAAASWRGQGHFVPATEARPGARTVHPPRNFARVRIGSAQARGRGARTSLARGHVGPLPDAKPKQKRPRQTPRRAGSRPSAGPGNSQRPARRAGRGSAQAREQDATRSPCTGTRGFRPGAGPGNSPRPARRVDRGFRLGRGAGLPAQVLHGAHKPRLGRGTRKKAKKGID